MSIEERQSDAELVEKLTGLLSAEEAGSDEPEARGEPEDEPDTTTEPEEESEGEVEDLEAEAPEETLEEPLEDEDEQEAYEDSEPTLYAVRVDGKTKEVTLDELTRGYSGQEVFTQRMQEAAEQSKTAGAELQRANGLAAEYEQALTILRERLAADIPAAPADEASEKEWGLYLREKAKIEEVDTHFREFQQFRHDEVGKQLAVLKEKETDLLMQAMPAWQDPEVAQVEKGKLVAYAHVIGMTDEDLANIYDHRVLLLIDKARRFDELNVKRGKVKGKRKAAPTLRPGASRGRTRPSKQKDYNKARERFMKSRGGRRELELAADLVKRTGLLG